MKIKFLLDKNNFSSNNHPMDKRSPQNPLDSLQSGYSEPEIIWEKNLDPSSKILRISVSDHTKAPRLDIRQWYRTASGLLRPSFAGVSLLPEQIEPVIKAFEKIGPFTQPTQPGSISPLCTLSQNHFFINKDSTAVNNKYKSFCICIYYQLFKNIKTLHVRNFFVFKNSNSWIPSRKGICIAENLIPPVLKAVKLASRRIDDIMSARCVSKTANAVNAVIAA